MKGRKPLPTNLKVLMGNPGKQKLPKEEIAELEKQRDELKRNAGKRAA